MRVAVLGGTGSFGRALAARLVALGERRGRDRLARRRAGGRGGAPSSGPRGATNEDGRRRRRPGGPRRQGRRGARHGPLGGRAARPDAAPLGRERDRVPEGRRHAARPRRAQPRRARSRTSSTRPSSPGCTRSPPRTSTTARRTRTRSSAATTRRRRSSCWRSPARLVGGRALDAGPLASARALEGLTAVIVNLNRRYKAHAGIRVTGVA